MRFQRLRRACFLYSTVRGWRWPGWPGPTGPGWSEPGPGYIRVLQQALTRICATGSLAPNLVPGKRRERPNPASEIRAHPAAHHLADAGIRAFMAASGDGIPGPVTAPARRAADSGGRSPTRLQQGPGARSNATKVARKVRSGYCRERLGVYPQ